jgi:hypothetical protein
LGPSDGEKGEETSTPEDPPIKERNFKFLIGSCGKTPSEPKRKKDGPSTKVST